MDLEGSERAKVPQENLVMVNLHNRKFANVSAQAMPAGMRKTVHRGAAFGDLDNDGRVDVVLTELHGPPHVWRNVSPVANHWLLVRTVGSQSNRDGLGARLKILTPSGTQYNTASPAVGYACSSDRRVHFGLGKETLIQELEVLWPSGKLQRLQNVKADQVLTVQEP